MQSLPKSVRVLCGAPIENGAERALMRRLVHDLEQRRVEGLVLVNFQAGRNSVQIDAVVALASFACVVEIKGYKLPVHGQLNGRWSQTLPDGGTRFLSARNPYVQALRAKFAVFDELGSLLLLPPEQQAARPCVSGMVCFFPSPPPGSSIPEGDFKASIGGYDDLLSLCRKVSPRAVPLAVWQKFADKLGMSEHAIDHRVLLT